jgi:cysteine synthase A
LPACDIIKQGATQARKKEIPKGRKIMMLHQEVLSLIGNTPMVNIRRMCGPADAEIWAKLEGCNPGGSVKDRIALAMIETAEREGKLSPGGTIIEPTSGNTGIGLAMVSSIKGYRLILTMPDTMSMERRQLLQAYGAELVLTEGKKRHERGCR